MGPYGPCGSLIIPSTVYRDAKNRTYSAHNLLAPIKHHAPYRPFSALQAEWALLMSDIFHLNVSGSSVFVNASNLIQKSQSICLLWTRGGMGPWMHPVVSIIQATLSSLSQSALIWFIATAMFGKCIGHQITQHFAKCLKPYPCGPVWALRAKTQESIHKFGPQE